MNKLTSIFRRMRLGEKFKHQYRCHPDFGLLREKEHCTVIWKGNVIAKIPFAHTLRDRYNGSCFTVASGPSLAEVDLKQLAAFDTISLNCAIKKFNDAGLKPTHCVAVDRRVFENHWECIKDSILSGANCFFSYVGLCRICQKEPELLQRNNIFLIESISRKFGVPRISKSELLLQSSTDAEIFLDSNHTELCRSAGFSANLEKGLFSGKTVATWATQLSPALGYQQNFILGMDLGGTGRKYFYSNGHHAPPDLMRDYEPHIRVCFEQAKRASVSMGFEIYNLSKDSTLPHEIIPKISMEQALAIAHHQK